MRLLRAALGLIGAAGAGVAIGALISMGWVDEQLEREP